MNKLSTTGKIGLTIVLFAGLIMVILVIFGQLIPDVLMWIYGVGLVITFSCIFTNKRNNEPKGKDE